MTYADAADSANLTTTQVKDFLNGLLTDYSTAVATGTPQSVASGAWTAITGATVSVTVATGEAVFIFGQANLSNSIADTRIFFQIYKDGSGVGSNSTAQCGSTSTGGDQQSAFNHFVEVPSVGAHTYALYWNGAAGTSYLNAARITVIKFQNT